MVMKGLAAFILSIILFQTCWSQETGTVTIAFDQTPLEEALISIETKSDIKIFFERSWLDSVFVSGEYNNITLPEVLDDILKETSIKYFLNGDQVILTQGLTIVDELPKGFFGESVTEQNTGLKPAFIREYTAIAVEEVAEDELVEIGRASQFVSNGKSTIAGYVREKVTGEPILGAFVFIREPFIGATTDSRGFYSITVPNGAQRLVFQYVGMRDLEQNIYVYSDGSHDGELVEDIVALKEVTIESERDANVNSVQMGVNSIDIKSVKNIPLALGEPDVLKVALTLPGVQSVGEGSAGFNVRGGSVDQNLITINGAPIFNPNHFFGFFSVLNSSVIKKLDLYKSSIPAQYGGRLSSIFDVQMIDGNQKKLSGSGNISPITAGLTLQGPIVKDKTSFVLASRATYSDWVLNLIPESSSFKDSDASFYDIVGKVSHQAGENDFIYLSGYYSKDRFRLSSDSLFSYHNANVALQWRHNFSNRVIGQLSGSYSEYDYNIGFNPFPVESFNSGYKIGETDLKLDLAYYQSQNHKVDFGYHAKYYNLQPGFIEPSGGGSEVIPQEVQQEKGLENALYISDNIDITPRLSVYLGLRYSLFTAFGPRAVYRFTPGATRSIDTVADTVQVSSGKAIKSYQGPEYRVSAKYSINTQTSIKVSYNRTRQYVHLLSNSISVAPTDTWKLSDLHIAPQIGDQYSLGLYRNMNNSSLETSIEGYYKDLQNTLDYKDGADLTLNQLIEADVIQGDGKAYGVEFLLKKKKGKINGWVSYTYSRTFLKLDGQFGDERVNGGDWFPANYDKPHDFTLISNYRLTRRYSISTNFTYSTGRPITFPVAKYNFAGGEKIHFSERNQFRIPDYIRLDIGVNIEGNHRVKKAGHGFWNISIYNLLGRRNVYSIFFNTNEGEIEAKRLSVFGAPIPTISYNFSF